MFLLVNLVIALRLEFGVRKGFLGANRIAEILDFILFFQFFTLNIGFGDRNLRTDVEKFYHLRGCLHVEIEEKLVFLLVEGADVVLVILEEWALAVGGKERIPVDVAPVGVVGDADVLHRQGDVVIGGDGERKRAVGGRDEHAVTIGLLDKALVALYQAFIVAVQLLVPLDGAEICGRKKGFQFLLCYEGLMMKRGTSDGIARNGGRRGTSFRRDSRMRQAEARSSGALSSGEQHERARSSGARELEQLMGFAYHLVLMNELLAGWRLQEIEAAILAAAALAADGWDDELHGVDAQRIARKLLYPAYEMRLEDTLAALVLGLVNHRIGENNHIATPEIFAVNPVHYHPVACLQLGRKPALRHREDSEDIGAHCPSQEQRQHQCY